MLDAFGGSGAFSLEAISRGAKSSTIIEIDRTAHNSIVENIKSLELEDNMKATRANVSSWSDNNPNQKFDIVFCNPPFDKLKLPLIQKLTKHVKRGMLFVLSWPTRQSAPQIPGLDLTTVKEKDYGDAQLVFYRKTE